MDKNKNIFIFGGGGHAKVVIDVLRSQYGQDCIAGIYDDDLTKKNIDFYNTKILGNFEKNKDKIPNLLIAIGNNQIRKEKAILISKNVENFITGIHSQAIISTSAKIGAGSVIMPGVTINADSIINNHCIVNSNAVVEHDCQIEKYVHIAPCTVLTGGVKIGELSFIGANSTIFPGVEIGYNCIVGAGTIVRKNVPDNSLVFGNPPKIIRNRLRNE